MEENRDVSQAGGTVDMGNSLLIPRLVERATWQSQEGVICDHAEGCFEYDGP